jgi:hypothetical protein
MRSLSNCCAGGYCLGDADSSDNARSTVSSSFRSSPTSSPSSLSGWRSKISAEMRSSYREATGRNSFTASSPSWGAVIPFGQKLSSPGSTSSS